MNNFETPHGQKPFGIVVCGGKSTRMGTDKSMLSYHGKPQLYHVYEMLEGLCEKVFISCNREQAGRISSPHQYLEDLPEFEEIGPMAAILTAFHIAKNHDFLVIGCDYPFLTPRELESFLLSIDKNHVATAFYNEEKSLYEPLLALYSSGAGEMIREMFDEGNYSLQSFLRNSSAGKFIGFKRESITSVDSPEMYEWAKKHINQQEDGNH